MIFQKRKTHSLDEFAGGLDVDGNILDISPVQSDETICEDESTVKINPYLGLFYIFATSLILILPLVFIKKLSYISPGHLALTRNAGMFAGSLPIAVFNAKQVLGAKEERLFLLVWSIIAGTTIHFNAFTNRYLPLAEVAIVIACAPAVTTLAARIFLKEHCGLVHNVCLVITFCGVLLSVRFPELVNDKSHTRFNSIYFRGLASAMGCILARSFTCVTLRQIKNTHISVVVLYISFLGMIENAAVTFPIETFVYPNCGWDVISVMLIGIFSLIGQCTMILSLQLEPVGIVAVLKNSLDIVVVVYLQITLFDEAIDIYNGIGACLVMMPITLTIFKKWLLTLPKESETRKRFNCFLL